MTSSSHPSHRRSTDRLPLLSLPARGLRTIGPLCVALLCLGMWLPAAVGHAVSQPPAMAAAASSQTALSQQIEAVIHQPRFAAARWGIAVVSLDSGRTLYAHQPDKLLQPASTAKLFTAAVALATLGADYRIQTRVLASGTIRHGRLDGPLILYGMGDPTLGTATSSDWADQLASQLAARNITRVKGDLIADDSYFRGPSYGSGWEADDLQSWFAVPASALSVDENIVKVTVSPAATVGLPASLRFDPVDSAPPTLGTITTTLSRDPTEINLYRAPGHASLNVFGNIATGSAQQHFKLALTDPALTAGRQLALALARHHIHLLGSVRVLHWPQDDSALLAHSDTLAQISSPPLLDILQRGLKRSQNLYLQNLLLNVGVHEQASTPVPGFTSTETYGIHALRALLTQIGIAAPDSLLDEGTGLSRRDLVTPAALVRLLAYLAAQPYADQLRQALPIAGVDGTLHGRLQHTAAENNLHAKTGSMTYVDTLAGYVTTAAGERLAFAIMLNNYEPPPDGPGASTDVDAIALLLAEYRGLK